MNKDEAVLFVEDIVLGMATTTTEQWSAEDINRWQTFDKLY